MKLRTCQGKQLKGSSINYFIDELLNGSNMIVDEDSDTQISWDEQYEELEVYDQYDHTIYGKEEIEEALHDFKCRVETHNKNIGEI